jgi:hypothetical protein
LVHNVLVQSEAGVTVAEATDAATTAEASDMFAAAEAAHVTSAAETTTHVAAASEAAAVTATTTAAATRFGHTRKQARGEKSCCQYREYLFHHDAPFRQLFPRRVAHAHWVARHRRWMSDR